MREGQERRVGALCRPRAVPVAGQRPHFGCLAARQQAHDVDLVRTLAQQDATAARVELLRAAQPIEEIGVVLRVDHPDRAKRAARDELAGARNGAIEAVAVADDHADAGARHGIDHRLAFVERHRHRLFHQNVLATRRGCGDMSRMELVGRGDVDDVDVRIGAQRLDARVRPRIERGGEVRRRLASRVRRRDQCDARIGDEGRQHQRERAPETGDADAKSRRRHRLTEPCFENAENADLGRVSTATIDFSIVT